MSGSPSVLLYPVKDIGRAKEFYEQLLGVAPEIDEPYYVQFKAGDLVLGLDPHGHSRGLQGTACYWGVQDVTERFNELLAAGATAHEAPWDVSNGSLVASVRDPDGNIIGLNQAD